MESKPRCDDCKAWMPLGKSGQGDCKRHAPQTFEGALAVWPRTMYDNWCWDFLGKDEILHEVVVPKNEVLSD
jgi:hypothetical protein